MDLSVSLHVSAPLIAGIKMTYPSSHCQGKAPAEIEGFYGISDLIFGLDVGFLDKHLGMPLSTEFSRIRWTR